MRCSAILLFVVLGAQASMCAAVDITFKGGVTDLKGRDLPPGAFASMRAVVVDDEGNRYNFRGIGKGTDQYEFIFDANNLAGVSDKGLRVTIAANGRVSAFMGRVYGGVSTNTIVDVDISLPEQKHCCCRHCKRKRCRLFFRRR